MHKPIVVGFLFLFPFFAAYSDVIPTLVFDGVNGYPSTGDSDYRVEIFVAENGLIFEIKSYEGSHPNENTSTKIAFEKDKIAGELQSKNSRTSFNFSIEENKINRRIIVYDKIKNAVYSDQVSSVVVAPRRGILFETDSRRFIQEKPNDFKIFDIETNEHLYTFVKNRIVNEGWYRSEWKTIGKKTTVQEFQTMEKNAEWIDAGHGVFIGNAFNSKDLLTNVVNFCILDAVYMNNPIFIPFIFGLKTGSY